MVAEAVGSLVTEVNTGSRVEGRSISMYPEDWRIVDEVAKRMGIGSSAVIRLMVRESALPQSLGLAADSEGD